MALFKKKESKEKESNPKTHASLLEIAYGRVLTAEGWKRRIALKTGTKSKSKE